LAVGVLAPPAGAAEAAIRGRFLVLGEAPAPEPLPPGRDACCQAAEPLDQSLVVGPERGLANVLVSIEPRRGEAEPPTSAPPSEPAVLANEGCAFAPRVLVVRVGQPLVLANADPTMHNVNIGFVRNPAINVVIPPEERRELTLQKTERRPVGVRCNVHTFMQGWIDVRSDPFAAITDRSGSFEIGGLPPGEWRLRFWREGEPLADLPVGDSATNERGEVVIDLPNGGRNLGDLAVPVERLR